MLVGLAASRLLLSSDAPTSIPGPHAMPLPVAHAASGRGARRLRPWVLVLGCPEQQRRVDAAGMRQKAGERLQLRSESIRDRWR